MTCHCNILAKTRRDIAIMDAKRMQSEQGVKFVVCKSSCNSYEIKKKSDAVNLKLNWIYETV